MPLRLCAFVPFFYLWTFEISEMQVIYNLGILFYTAIARIIYPFNRKVRLWVDGRRKWFESLKQKVNPQEKYIWIHCASLGEFEQGRPVIESLRKVKPRRKVIITFFSPSGYEIRKNYKGADIICYLPFDTPGNAKKFISLINPVFAIFVKYEFWNNFISELSRKSIPVYLISGIFRKEQIFFKAYGAFFRKMLMKFKWIYVQDELSSDLLHEIGINNVSVAGDTRFDRVMQIAASTNEIPRLAQFRGNEKLFLAGSSWRQDEEIISRYINEFPEKMKWVLAPHEVDPENIERLMKLFTAKCVRFSEFSDNSADARILIIDNIGMLSSAYRYAYIAAVGGGFGKGIHNILEAACWGIPVLFGPNHKKFREAIDLLKLESAKSFDDYNSFKKILDDWISSADIYKKAAESSRNYVNKNTGATSKIVNEIE